MDLLWKKQGWIMSFIVPQLLPNHRYAVSCCREEEQQKEEVWFLKSIVLLNFLLYGKVIVYRASL